MNDGVERPELMVIQAEGKDGTTALFSLAALLDQDGRVRLFQARNLTGSAERQDAIENREIEICVVLRYLLACKGAVEPVTHSSGVRYSRLDVEKAIRLKAGEKAETELVAATDDDYLFLSLGDARRALTEGPEAPGPVGADGGGKRILRLAALEAKAGRLFVIENLSPEIVGVRESDVYDAVRRGALRPPFEPASFILATVEGKRGAYLLCASANGTGRDVEFYGFRPRKTKDGVVAWAEPPKDTDRKTDPGAAVFLDALQAYVFVCLSLIADSRSPVTRVEAPEKLNKARVKRGKPPIPPYWRIEPSGPTILIPGAVPGPAAAKGGTHASPRPHDRRGHPRHLKGGRTVWVRDCKINALIPHLTRGRSFYEVRP